MRSGPASLSRVSSNGRDGSLVHSTVQWVCTFQGPPTRIWRVYRINEAVAAEPGNQSIQNDTLGRLRHSKYSFASLHPSLDAPDLIWRCRLFALDQRIPICLVLVKPRKPAHIGSSDWLYIEKVAQTDTNPFLHSPSREFVNRSSAIWIAGAKMLATQKQKPHHASRPDTCNHIPTGKLPTTIKQRQYYTCKMPTTAALSHFGLQAGDRARARDTECSICKENVKDPVVTQCNHVYCFECIHQWFSISTRCPDCRRNLYQACLRQPVQRFSSSAWVRASSLVDPNTEDFQRPDHAPRAPSRNHDRSTRAAQEIVGARARPDDPLNRKDEQQLPLSTVASSTSYQYRQAPLVGRRARRHNRATPSFGSSAYHNVEFPPPKTIEHERLACASFGPHMKDESPMTAEYRAMREIIRLNGGRIPRSTMEHDVAAARAGVVAVDAEKILADMWLRSQSVSSDVHVPIRCRAIMKCIWREWRDFLHRRHGHWLLAEEVLKALSRSIERTVVEYGWVESWQELPDAFIWILKHTAQAAVANVDCTRTTHSVSTV